MEMVFTAICSDRPGVVEALAKVVADNSGNWIDSSMSRLGGEFAGIVRIRVPDERANELEQALAALEAVEGIQVTLRRDAVEEAEAGLGARLDLVGQDRPGIVLKVTQLLAGQGVNVDELRTQVFTASMSGEPMFRAEAEIMLPADGDVAALRDALEEIANDLTVDIELQDVGAA